MVRNAYWSRAGEWCRCQLSVLSARDGEGSDGGEVTRREQPRTGSYNCKEYLDGLLPDYCLAANSTRGLSRVETLHDETNEWPCQTMTSVYHTQPGQNRRRRLNEASTKW